MFISIEGIEGAGKSTLASALLDFLKQQKKQAILTREPGGTPLAESIRHLLLHAHPEEALLPKAELLLMFASRIQHIETLIKPALAKKQWVICDRFVDASFAYQGGGREIPFDQIAHIESYALAGLKPDLTLLLDLTIPIAEQRLANKKKDKIEQENSHFFESVRLAYLQRAKNDPDRIKIIDATLPPGQIIKAALCYIERLLNDK